MPALVSSWFDSSLIACAGVKEICILPTLEYNDPLNLRDKITE